MLLYSPTLYDKTLAANKGNVVVATINSCYKNVNFWKNNSSRIASHMYQQMKNILGFKTKDVDVNVFKTPIDLYSLTHNYLGAMRGWASTSNQCSRNIFPSKSTLFSNLYFAGHWVTTEFGQGGLANVANTARKVAEEIVRIQLRGGRNLDDARNSNVMEAMKN